MSQYVVRHIATIKPWVDEGDVCTQAEARGGIESHPHVTDQRLGLGHHEGKQGTTHGHSVIIG